jgi:lysophospholipase L1-like esterase
MNKKTTTVLFQGDSITDCGRPYDLEGKSYCESLGHGYVKILAGRLPLAFPEKSWQVLNRGVSGNKVTQLYARWQTDTLNLKPDILSILVGVNDVWHGLPENGGDFNGVPAAHFERTYHTLLDFTRETLPEVHLILGEPFLLHGTAWSKAFQQGVEERQAVVRRIAEETGSDLVPYQSAFDQALRHLTVADLAPDGVHPTNLGNTVMADAWMKTFTSRKDDR